MSYHHKMEPDFTALQEMFSSGFEVFDIRPNIQEIHIPIYAEDGDPHNIYLRTEVDGRLTLTDLGATVMKLSYDYNADTEARSKILRDILRENRVEYDDGEISLNVASANIYPYLLHFAQVLGKVSAMEYHHKEPTQGLFEESIRNYVHAHLQKYDPKEGVSHLGANDDYRADYAFTSGLARPVFLFTVGSNQKASETNACLLAYQNSTRPFYGMVVFGDAAVSRRYVRRLTYLSDKTFLELDDFLDSGARQMQRFEDRG